MRNISLANGDPEPIGDRNRTEEPSLATSRRLLIKSSDRRVLPRTGTLPTVTTLQGPASLLVEHVAAGINRGYVVVASSADAVQRFSSTERYRRLNANHWRGNHRFPEEKPHAPQVGYVFDFIGRSERI
jgi:hypothetical protein